MYPEVFISSLIILWLSNAEVKHQTGLKIYLESYQSKVLPL